MLCHPLVSVLQYKVQRDVVIALVLVVSIIGYYCIFASHHTTIVRQMGMFCNFFTILFFASPLASMVSEQGDRGKAQKKRDGLLMLRFTGSVGNLMAVEFDVLLSVTPQAEVVRTKSTETMSFPLSVMSVCTAGSWVIYGVLIKDTYVIVSSIYHIPRYCEQYIPYTTLL